MDEVERLINRARSYTDKVVAHTGGLLASGADVNRVQRNYVAAALELATEAEAQALIAAGGDQAAQRALKGLVAQLARLHAEAENDRRYAEGEAE